MNRIIVLVDGFNLYHSVRDIQRQFGVCYKWLDIYSLCKSFCQLISRDTSIENIYYFTALATHLNDMAIVKRHTDYIRCLEETGISVEYGKFKPKVISCPKCNREFIRHEEKETDVRIATKVCHILACNECDSIIIVSGDTDLVPCVEHAKTCFPEKAICFAFPFARKNDQLKQIAPESFKINKKNYAKYQLPNPFPISGGSPISKPNTW